MSLKFIEPTIVFPSFGSPFLSSDWHLQARFLYHKQVSHRCPHKWAADKWVWSIRSGFGNAKNNKNKSWYSLEENQQKIHADFLKLKILHTHDAMEHYMYINDQLFERDIWPKFRFNISNILASHRELSNCKGFPHLETGGVLGSLGSVKISDLGILSLGFLNSFIIL